MDSKPKVGLTIAVLFAFLCTAVIVLYAIENDLLIPLIVGFTIVSVALIAASAVTVKHVAVPLMEVRFKYMDARLEHERLMTDLRLRHTPQLPPGERHPEVEQYRTLAVQLIALTCEKMGADADRVISREKAEKFPPFNTHDNWSNGVKFLTTWGLAYESVLGGRNEGLRISKNRKACELNEIIPLLGR